MRPVTGLAAIAVAGAFETKQTCVFSVDQNRKVPISSMIPSHAPVHESAIDAVDGSSTGTWCHEWGCCHCLSNNILLRCSGREWHMASFRRVAKFGRYWGKADMLNGFSEGATVKSLKA
jgi:hypothetical protein